MKFFIPIFSCGLHGGEKKREEKNDERGEVEIEKEREKRGFSFLKKIDNIEN